MIDEPNARNQHHQQEEPEAAPALLPEIDALAARLTADGAVWQSRLPDPARVAERIRAIPHDSLFAASEGDIPVAHLTIVAQCFRHTHGRLRSYGVWVIWRRLPSCWPWWAQWH